LKLPRIILHAGQRGDFFPRQFGREPLQAHVGKTDRGHRAPQPHRAARHHRQRRKLALRPAIAGSLAASTFTTLAAMIPALVTNRTCAASLTTCSFVMRNPSSVMKKPVPLLEGRDAATLSRDSDEPASSGLRGLNDRAIRCATEICSAVIRVSIIDRDFLASSLPCAEDRLNHRCAST
jgi:hypothetical protein